MSCDEYKKLNLLHQSAECRVKRYAHPDEEGMRRINALELEERLKQARVEEINTRLAMQAHSAACTFAVKKLHSAALTEWEAIRVLSKPTGGILSE